MQQKSYVLANQGNATRMLVASAFVILKNGKDVHQEQMGRMNCGIFTQWTRYDNKVGQTTSILPHIAESQECNVKLDTEVCQRYDSIYTKFKRVEKECLLFKVRMLVILGQNGLVVTRGFLGGWLVLHTQCVYFGKIRHAILHEFIFLYVCYGLLSFLLKIMHA